MFVRLFTRLKHELCFLNWPNKSVPGMGQGSGRGTQIVWSAAMCCDLISFLIALLIPQVRCRNNTGGR